MLFLPSAFLMVGTGCGEIALLHNSGSVSVAWTEAAGDGPCCGCALDFVIIFFVYATGSQQVSFNGNLYSLALKAITYKVTMTW